MCVYMYVCVYTLTYAHTHAHTHTYTYAYTHTHTHTHTHTQIETAITYEELVTGLRELPYCPPVMFKWTDWVELVERNQLCNSQGLLTRDGTPRIYVCERV